jgi:hypothetical protein
MSQLKRYFFCLLLVLFFSCEFSPTSDDDLSGSAAVSISVGKIGSLQKSQSNISIGLKNLVVTLKAADEKDIIDTLSLDGTSQITIIKCYDNLSPKLWTLSAISFDQAGEIIHSGQRRLQLPTMIPQKFL